VASGYGGPCKPQIQRDTLCNNSTMQLPMTAAYQPSALLACEIADNCDGQGQINFPPPTTLASISANRKARIAGSALDHQQCPPLRITRVRTQGDRKPISPPTASCRRWMALIRPSVAARRVRRRRVRLRQRPSRASVLKLIAMPPKAALTPPDTSSRVATARCPSPRYARSACRRAPRPGSGRGWAGCNCPTRRGR
jgi:hypothetical protein